MNFDDFIKEVGINAGISGIVFDGKTGAVTVMLPGVNSLDPLGHPVFETDVEMFKKMVRQMDTQETTLYSGDKNKKTIVRKTQRQLDNKISWKVFARDEYTCRYCGREGSEGVPMSYDHVKLWEEGGENTMENGVCACRKCNKTRGNTDYSEWLDSDEYSRTSKNVSEKFRNENEKLRGKYRNFPERISKRSR